MRQTIGRPAVGARRAFNAFLRSFSNDALKQHANGVRSVMQSWRAALGAIVVIAPDQAAKIQLFLQEMRKDGWREIRQTAPRAPP